DLVQSRVSAVIPALLEYFASGRIIDGSIGPRLEMWGASWAIFTQNPIFGAGVGSYFEVKTSLIEQGLIDPSVARFVQSHNQLLQSLAEGGLLGMACVYGIYTSMILVFRKALTSNKPAAVSGLMLTIAFIDFGMADGIWSITNAGTFFAVMAVIFTGFVSGTKSAS
nr:O-antigen ligase family protein [Oceanospirillaceae bacterium]